MSEDADVIPELFHTRIVVRKAQRRLELFEGEKLIKTYGIALGPCPLGSKEVEGDGRTPEGEFWVVVKNPKSKFHLSLGLNYPSNKDARRGHENALITESEYGSIIEANAAKTNPPQKTRLGGEIYIHGGGTEGDWTEGCIALADDEMSELFSAVPLGTSVTILP